jgi:hypothetical protein
MTDRRISKLDRRTAIVPVRSKEILAPGLSPQTKCLPAPVCFGASAPILKGAAMWTERRLQRLFDKFNEQFWEGRLADWKVELCPRLGPLRTSFPTKAGIAALSFPSENPMLRIQRSSNGGVLFTLSGRIELEDVSELQRLLSLETVNGHLALDLRDVTLVDRDAVKLLAECETQSMKLENCPAYIREWITRETDRINRGKR